MTARNSVFEQFRTLIHKESGIFLSQEKEQLLVNRIQKRLRSLGVSSAEQYLEIIESDLTGDELTQLLDAVSTNVTFFWREEAHFVQLREILKERKVRGETSGKIWCAASSSGEEPYTLAMIAQECGCEGTRVLATDISTRILLKAVRGRYELRQLEKLPVMYKKYFSEVHVEGDAVVEVVPEISKKVVFKRLNLSKFPFPLQGGLDVIFCRNVMIYFNNELRQKIINEFTRLLNPGGHLFIGHSENLLGVTHSLQSVETAHYRKSGGGGR